MEKSGASSAGARADGAPAAGMHNLSRGNRPQGPGRGYGTQMTVGLSLPPTVLVIEDDPDIRSGVVELLSAEGYGVATAENGCVALEQLRHAPRPALILLDLKMPVMDGWGFLNAQRDDRKLAPIPVLMFTTSLKADEARLKYPSVRGSVSKLLDIAGLLDAVRRYTSGLTS
jgi:CheY-like chemotaxis protein